MPLKLGSDVFAACDNATAIPDIDDEDNDTVSSDLQVKVYRKRMAELRALRQFKGRIVCVRFGDDTDAKSPNLEYTLHFFVSSISNDFLKLNRPTNFFLPGTDSNDAELLDKLHGVQIRINRAHLELQNEQHTWNPTWNYTTYQRLMPIPEFPTEPQHYRPGVVVAAIALVWLFFRHLANLTRETSSGLKASVPSVPGERALELQCVMGLSDAVYWIGHYLSFLVLILAESLIVLVYMVTIKQSDLGVVFLENTAVSLLLAAFLICCLLLPLLILLLSCVSPKGVYASLLGLAFYLVLPFIQLDAISWIHGGVGDYIFFGRSTKLLSCIFPQLGICLVLQGISLENDYIGNAGWGIIGKRALGLDNVTIFEIWLVMVSSGLGVVVLIWYLTRPSYWSPPAPVRTAENLTANHNPNHFERAPNDAEPVIVTRDLIKNFWTTKALDGVDLEMYESQITVLLGHNGAGKSTLMNILTGMLKPSGGVALVCGYDIVKNTTHARKSLGFCQQGDVFFTDLTTWEHVVYFAKLKGLGRTQAKTQARDTLTAVGLDSKLNDLPEKLSGGMKRRLFIAMAVVSSPKVVLLDEPTAGLDPENKREVWDLLLGMRAKTTLIISTHDMDEADVLADRIVVMAEGRALCSGSPAFLKKAYGVGYQLRILKKPGTFALLTVVNIIKTTAPNAEEKEKQNEVIVALNTLSHRGFISMFKELELHQSSLGIGAIGVTVATMRDVYVK
ncbi:ABC transporter, putative [Ixodes scapularis]|uniref:ABC transporter, putative n=1 Tax=Ixodes scapularis TaxID=6945 RepID=B7Q6X0_IXOSC|nr:ABC transporter, putative [Ixodes scapularis]|eukprot:XP_002403450.1 ABC transporter, putative [Ixodes scapularis]